MCWFLERKIVDRFRDIAGSGNPGRAGLRGVAFVSAGKASATAFGAAATEELYVLYAECERDAGSPVVLGIGPYFGSSFCIYLGTFLEIGGDAGTIRPIRTFNPNGLIFLVSLGVTEFLGVGHVEIDHILSIHRISDTVFTQVADYLELYHNIIFYAEGQFTPFLFCGGKKFSKSFPLWSGGVASAASQWLTGEGRWRQGGVNGSFRAGGGRDLPGFS